VKEKEKDNEKEGPRYTPGTLLKIEGLAADTTREDIKEALTAIEGVEIAYAEFETGQTEGIIRFKRAEDAEGVLTEFKSGEKKIKDAVPKFTKIDGEEEKQYYEKLQAIKGKKGKGRGRGGKFGKGRGRGGHKFGKGGKGGRGKRGDD